MSHLIVVLGDDFAHANALIATKLFSPVFLIADNSLKHKYVPPSVELDMTLLTVDFSKSAQSVVSELVQSLREDINHQKVHDLEIAVHLSGSGTANMIAIASIIQLGFGMRFVTLEHGKLVEVQ